MRRSARITLGSMVFGATAAVAGCGKSEQTVYKDVAACSVDHPAADCQKAMQSAADAWKNNSIANTSYQTRDDCVTGEGTSCDSLADGKYAPAMTGFVLASAAAGAVALPAIYRRDRHCGYSSNDSCSTGSGAHGIYIGRGFYRSSTSAADGVTTQSIAREAASRAAAAAHADAETARGGMGGAAEGHGGGGE